MTYTFAKGDQSNYVITVTFNQSDKEHEKAHVLQHFQQTMDVPGFRKGHVPLSIVEKEIKSEYLDLEIEEHIINHAIQHILEENKDIKFIGEPYGFDKKNEGENTTIEIKLDIYPEVEVKNDSWKKEKVEEVVVKVDKKEVDDALLQLKREYADYEDADKIDIATLSKIGVEFVGEDGKVVKTKNLYLGETEFNQSDFFKDTFIGCVKGQEIEIDYSDKKLPEDLKINTQDPVVKIKAVVKDIKRQVLPDFIEENIKKFFEPDLNIKNEADLKVMIEKNISQNKYLTTLVQNIEKYLSNLKEKVFSVIVPHSMIQSEFAERIKSLESRFGSKEKVKEFIQKMSEDESKKFFDDIESAAKNSLEKFLILIKVTELLGIQVDWEADKNEEFLVEKQIYAHFYPSESEIKEKKNASKTKTSKSDEQGGEEKGEEYEGQEKVEKKTVKRTRKTSKKEEE